MAKHHEVKHFNIPVDLSYIDKLPYNVHPDTKRQISLVSGNLIKYYSIHMDEEKKIIDPIDLDPDVIDSYAKDNDQSNEQNNNLEVSSDDFKNLEDSVATNETSNLESHNSSDVIDNNSEL